MALTGVGPSMASGNQTCSGNCALLPTVPKKIRTAIRASSGVSTPINGILITCSPKRCRFSIFNTSLNWRLAGSLLKYSSIMPINIMVSPMRVVTNALMDAARAVGFSYQKPMSK